MTSVVAELLGQYYVIPWIMWLGNMPVAFLVLLYPGVASGEGMVGSLTRMAMNGMGAEWGCLTGRWGCDVLVIKKRMTLM